jgi:hypothetical protein
MRTSILSATAMALLSATAVAAAAQTSGHYYNHTTSVDRIALPNGNTAVQTRFFEMIVTDSVNDPTNHLAGSCSAQTIVSKDGKTLSASGICFMKDSDGDSLPHWFKFGETGTASCPEQCGSFGFMPGTGKFKGITGSGTWKRTHAFGDAASSGTFTQTYRTP